MSIADLLTHSPTVAVLNARGELRRLRMLVNPNDDAVRAELDHLEDLLGDLCDVGRLVEGGDMMLLSDVEEDYVSKEDFDEEREDREKAEEERDDARHELDVVEQDRDEAQGALEDSEDEVRRKLGEALRRVTALQSENASLRASVGRAEKRCEALKSPLAGKIHAALYPAGPSPFSVHDPAERRSKVAMVAINRMSRAVEDIRARVKAALTGETP